MHRASLVVLFLGLSACHDTGTGPCSTATGGACSTSPTTSTGTASSSTSTSTTSGSSATTSSSSTSGSGGADGGAPAAHVVAHVTDGAQQPIGGAAVVVNDAEGHVVDQAAADADGKVALAVPAGGAITAFHAFGLDFVSVTVVDPPDGADARLVLRGPLALPPVSTPSTQFVANISKIPPNTSDFATVTCASAQHTFFNSPAPASATLGLSNASCLAFPTASYLFIASNTLKVPIAWAAAFDQPTSPGGSQPFAVSLTHSNFDALTASITAIAPGVATVSVALAPQAAASSPLAYKLAQTGSGTTQSFATSFTVPQGIFASYQVTERADLYGDAYIGTVESHVVRQRSYAHLPATTSFAVNAMALVSVDPLDLADPVHPEITWSTAEGARGDYASIKLGWSRGTAQRSCTVYLPPERAAAFRMPDVPADLAAFAPSAAAVIGMVAVDYVDEEGAAGFAASSLFRVAAPVDGLGTITSGGSNPGHTP